jgi:hypothetical protein
MYVYLMYVYRYLVTITPVFKQTVLNLGKIIGVSVEIYLESSQIFLRDIHTITPVLNVLKSILFNVPTSTVKD